MSTQWHRGQVKSDPGKPTGLGNHKVLREAVVRADIRLWVEKDLEK